ncbi:MAG TPA: tetratricopeptide repeat protein, partial [Chitinophagaceae bacterium]|nr:tetratricopeptide repeat protein [Chitinophagaceae bacterium]
MIVRITISIFFNMLFVLGPASAQNTGSYQNDTAKVVELIAIAQRYRFFKPDSCVPFAEKALEISRSINYKSGEVAAYITLGEYHRVSGNYPESLEHLFKALQISLEIGDSARMAEAQGFIGIAYLSLKEYETALRYLFHAYSQKHFLAPQLTGFILTNTGVAYREMNRLDSALIYQKMAWLFARNVQMPALKAFVLRETGNVYILMDRPDSAFYYYRYALSVTPDILNVGRTYSRMAAIFHKLKQYDSILYYANHALALGRLSSQKPTMLEASKTLAAYYIDKNKFDSAVKYQQLTMAINDSLFGSEQLRRLQLLAIDEQKRVHAAEQKQLETEQKQKDYQSNLRFYGLIAALAVFMLFGLILFRNNKRQKIANAMLQRQKKQTEDTLDNLRATQAQLIQSEKMASLGELTAGIAHEIQNPLNFVNNFSEVNEELLKELKAETENGNLEQVKAIARDIEFNSEKINHHGKRAESIVKGMLQHSRASAGQKEPTDINALADEYLRLAYHGLRAKDKSFNATIRTEFDNSIGKVNIIPQD